MVSHVARLGRGLRAADPLLLGALVVLGTLSGLGRGAALPVLPLLGLLAMFWCVVHAPTSAVGLANGMCFGLGEAGTCFLGSYSWGAYVPASLTLLCVLVHHLPLSLWARYAPARIEGRWLWLGSLGLFASLGSVSEAMGLPNREAVVLVTTLPEMVGATRWFGADLMTAAIETTMLAAALATRALASDSSLVHRLGLLVRPIVISAFALALFGKLATVTAPAAEGSLSVGIPQIAADSTFYNSRLRAPAVAERFRVGFDELTRHLHAAELLVTTEEYDGGFGLMLPALREQWAKRSERMQQAWLVTSSIVKKSGRKSNAAGGFTPQGQLVGVHEKVDLAPFGERDLQAGAGYHPLPILSGVSLGVMICQESYLQRGTRQLVQKGANLLAVTTSDVTFGASTTVIEHLAMTELRALESGRSIVWASNAGPSGVIDRWGHFQRGPMRAAAAIAGKASLHSDTTAFLRYYWLWIGMGPALLGSALLTANRRPSRTTSNTPPASFGLVRYLAGIALLPVAVTTGVGTTVVTQARWGAPEPATSVIAATFLPKPTLSDPDPYRRFVNAPGHSAEGAIAFLLEYYGAAPGELGPIESLPPAAPLEDVARVLHGRYGLSTRRVDWREPAPFVPVLLRSVRGEYAVVDYAGGGHGGLIDFSTGATRYITVEELRALRGVEALLPYAANFTGDRSK